MVGALLVPQVEAVQKLVSSDLDTGDQFGRGVAIDGEFLVVGAPFATDDTEETGAAYVFQRTGNTWSEVQKLTPGDGAGGDQFGFSVAIEEDLIAVGAPEHDPDVGAGPLFRAGAAYVFRYDGTTWSEEAKLVPAAMDVSAGDRSGWSVAVEKAVPGDSASEEELSNVVVGAPGVPPSDGKVFLFELMASNWNHLGTFTDEDPMQSPSFGWSVDMSADQIVVGGPNDGETANNSGAMWSLRRQGILNTWFLDQKLKASDAALNHRLGWSVAIHDRTAVAGAPDTDPSSPGPGSAYVFNDCCVVFTNETRLIASDGAPDDKFGESVAVRGRTVVVGARNDEGTAGSAYVFHDAETTWNQVAKLVPGDGAATELFGSSAAVSEGVIVVGAPFDSETLTSAGAAYTYGVPSLRFIVAGLRPGPRSGRPPGSR